MVVEPLRPSRGGFLRPFGCGWFIREFLIGHGPNGSPKIDHELGAPQADMFYHYKTALLKATAQDRATRREEKQARREKRAEPASFTPSPCHRGQGEDLPRRRHQPLVPP